jgi:tRNA G46 methylase TrmB
MFANSRTVDSGQRDVHPRLVEIVAKHWRETYRKPVADVSRAAFDTLAARLAGDARPRVLDAGCGTGASTLALARRHRDAVVIGVDKSADRLGVGQRALAREADAANAILLRCELVDFWLLAASAGWRFERQYLLYPNPWPKAEYVMRRWGGHPVLPALIACGGALELRTNWDVYAREWALALRVVGREACVEAFDGEGLTPFESKYAASGHGLWRVVDRVD